MKIMIFAAAALVATTFSAQAAHNPSDPAPGEGGAGVADEIDGGDAPPDVAGGVYPGDGRSVAHENVASASGPPGAPRATAGGAGGLFPPPASDEEDECGLDLGCL